MKALIVALGLVLAACAARPSEHQIWAAKRTPATWKPGVLWTFIVLDKDRAIIKSLALRFTNKTAKTCTSGDWRAIEIVGQYPPPHPNFDGVPAYTLEGAALMVDLTSNLCDSSKELRGELTENGVSGTYETQYLYGQSVLGSFYAVPVQQ